MQSSKGEEEDERGDHKKQEEKQNDVVKAAPKGKSCKGYLYYSSSLKSHKLNPRCIGIPRTLPQVPNYVVGQSEIDASKDVQALLDFYYACAGYSVYTTNLQDVSNDKQRAKRELPVCVGLELLVNRQVANVDAAPAPAPAHAHAPAHARNREDVHGVTRPRVHTKPAHSLGDDFLGRFTRNAGLVAAGVARNMRRVGNHIKESLDDIFYPYRKRPK